MSISIKCPVWALCLALLLPTTGLAVTAGERPNILFIAIDDLNDWVGFLDGHPQVKTPEMDRLAEQGVVFTEAHCPAPVCGPSRASIMSGIWPYNNGVYSNNAHYPRRLPGVESMPGYLKRQGYRTMGAGKLFHGGRSSYPAGSFDLYAPDATRPFGIEHLDIHKQNPSHVIEVQGVTLSLPLNGMPADRPWQSAHTFDWGPVDLPDSSFRDTQNVDWVIEQLDQEFEAPFFMGMGFFLPHQPLYAPKRFHDLYPPEEVKLPPYLEGDIDDLSRAGKEYALIATTSGTHRTVAAFKQWRNAVSCYLATVSFVDHLLGRLMSALRASSHADNTWIVLWSDHGWHLGEKEHWGKATGWYRSTRVPLMIVPPAGRGPDGFLPGSVSSRPVNLIDLFPTLVDLAGLPENLQLEGKSLLPLVADPDAPWEDHTVSTFGRGNHAITTNRWRYIQYFDGSAELYDRKVDPNEWNNLIQDRDLAPVVRKLEQKVPQEKQWKHFVRYNHFKAVVPVDSSPMLLYNLDVENHLEERFSEAEDYPEIVRHIAQWLAANRPEEKRLDISGL